MREEQFKAITLFGELGPTGRKHSFYQALFISVIDMILVMQQQASVCGFHMNFCLNVYRLVKQLFVEKQSHAIVFYLHCKLNRLMTVVKNLKEDIC